LANELKVEQVDLLPCPFCGGGAVLRYVRDGKETFCKGCGACGPSAFHGPNRDTEERAVSAWNHRIASEKPRTPVSVGESENIRVKIGELVDCAVRGDNPVIIANQIAWWFRQLEAEKAEREEWRDIASAPRDHRMLELIVDYSGEDADHALQDTARYGVTIGFNGFEDTGEDEWFLAGWCWSHDHFTAGRGVPVAWRPARLDEETDGLAEIAAELETARRLTNKDSADGV